VRHPAVTASLTHRANRPVALVRRLDEPRHQPRAKVAFAVPPSSRELPTVPSFHAEPALDLRKQFIAALKELTGVVVTEPPPDFDKFLKERFPNAKTICSGVPEYAGNSKPEDFARWSDASSIDVTVVRSPLGVAEPPADSSCPAIITTRHYHQPHGMLCI